LLGRRLHCRLILEFGQALANDDVIETAHEKLLKPSLHDGSNGDEFTSNDAVDPDPRPVGAKCANNCYCDREQQHAGNPPEPPRRSASMYRDHPIGMTASEPGSFETHGPFVSCSWLCNCLDYELAIEFSKMLATHHTVQTVNAQTLQAGLDDGDDRREFTGNTVASNPRRVGGHSGNDCRPDCE
jgi:hypothetical protein